MKKLVVAIIIICLMPCVASAKCKGDSGAVGFLNPQAFMVAIGMTLGGGVIGSMNAISTFVASGDAILFGGVDVEIIQTNKVDDRDTLAIIEFQNGTRAFTFLEMIKCR